MLYLPEDIQPTAPISSRRLARCHEHGHQSGICWIAKGFDNSVDLRCQTASTTAYFLFEVPPFAPTPYWCSLI
jgi:hypothetical protein